VLNASKLAFYNDVVQILDLMRSIGGDRVALSTLPAEGNPLNVTPVPTLTPYGVAPNPSVPFNPGQTPLPAPVPGATPNVNPSAPNLFNQPLPGTSPSNTSPSGNSRQ
jgi:biopolymer transport protein ExbD